MTKAILFGLLGSLFVTFVGASGQDVLTLGECDREPVEYLLVKASKVFQVVEDVSSPEEVEKLARSKGSPLLFYDNTCDGSLVFVGAGKVAYASKTFWANIEHATQEDFAKLFERNKPMALSTFEEKHGKPEGIPWPKIPVQAAKAMQILFLDKRPSDHIALKFEQSVWILEVVAVAEDESNIKAKIHAVKHLPKKALPDN